MSRYLLYDTRFSEFEQMMMLVPNFTPRKRGLIVMKNLKAESSQSIATYKRLVKNCFGTFRHRLCASAGVEPGKVFPHNLRHLFARTYYRLEKDLFRLADLLGHSNVSTTRIYTMEIGTEHAKQLDRLGLVCSKS